MFRYPYVAPLLFALACGPSEPERMRGAIDPYLDEFAEYDRWARRMGLADSAFHSVDALREAAFAPLQDHPRVRAAWIDREGPDAATLAHPTEAPAPPAEGWVRVTTEELGELAVSRANVTLENESVSCLLIRRSRPAPGDATLHVTIAFVPALP